MSFSLSVGNANDAPEGKKLLHFTPSAERKQFLLMDRAYADKKMRITASELGYELVVPPKRNLKEQWDYDKELYKQRNVVGRFFRRIKRFRRIFTRYDKLDEVFAGFILKSARIPPPLRRGMNRRRNLRFAKKYAIISHERR